MTQILQPAHWAGLNPNSAPLVLAVVWSRWQARHSLQALAWGDALGTQCQTPI